MAVGQKRDSAMKFRARRKSVAGAFTVRAYLLSDVSVTYCFLLKYPADRLEKSQFLVHYLLTTFGNYRLVGFDP